MTTIKVGHVEFDLVKIYDDVRNKSVLRLYDPELLDTAADQMLYDIGIRDTLRIVTRKETLCFSYWSRMCRVSQKYRGIVGIELRKKLIKSFSDRMRYENGPDFCKPVLLNGVERQAPIEMRLDEWIYIIDDAYYNVYHVNDFIVSGETLIADLPCNCKILTK